MKPEVKAAVDLIKSLRHQDEEYLGDHWATGRCQRCLAEVELGVRDPHFGGYSVEQNRRIKAEHEAEALSEMIG